MLVLTRRKDQTVKIGPDIEIIVNRTSRDCVIFGITAPDDVLILRGEVEAFSEGVRTVTKEEKK